MPRNLDSGAKIGSATFVATSVGFGPQGGQGGGGIRTHDRWDPRAASLTIGPRGVISPGESSPRGITPLGDTPWRIVPQGNHSPERDPLGNRLPGESSPWERPPWGIVPQGNHSPGRHPPSSAQGSAQGGTDSAQGFRTRVSHKAPHKGPADCLSVKHSIGVIVESCWGDLGVMLG